MLDETLEAARMSDQELRFVCLRMAIEVCDTGPATIASAQMMFNFVRNGIATLANLPAERLN